MGSVKRRPDGKWRARYRDNSGKEHAQHFARRVDAEQWLAAQVTDVQRGAWVDPRLGRQTFGDYAARWLAVQVHLRPASRGRIERTLRNHILPTFGNHRLAAITRTECQTWVAERAQMLGPGSVRVAHQVFAQILRAAVDDGVLAVSPARRLSMPKVEADELNVLTVAQVDALVVAMPVQLRAMVELSAGSGLRYSEAAGLTVGQVDWMRRSLRVDRQLTNDGRGHCPPKTKASVRTVPLADVTLAALSNHLAAFPSDGLMFSTRTGRAWRANSFSPHWQRSCTAVNIAGARFHDLRDFYASLLINAGLSVKAVQVVLGHDSATVTLNTYAKLWPSDDESTRTAVTRALVREKSAEVRTTPGNRG